MVEGFYNQMADVYSSVFPCFATAMEVWGAMLRSSLVKILVCAKHVTQRWQLDLLAFSSPDPTKARGAQPD